MSEPPLLPPELPPQPDIPEPPLLPVPTTKKAGPALCISAILVGLLQMILAVMVTQRGTQASRSIPENIGYVLGSSAVWPLVLIGLFSIGKTFRNTRSRLIIILSVWGLFSYSHLGNLAQAHRQSITAKNAAVTPLPTAIFLPDAGNPESGPADPSIIPVPSHPSTSSPIAFDFSPGSAERLIKQIEHSQETSYHAVVAGYAAAIHDHPLDAGLALERVRFTLRFASSEDVTIDSAEADYETAKSDLTRLFPETPGTILFLLEQTWGEAFNAMADRYSPLVASWDPVNAAKFLLLRAERAPPAAMRSKLGYARGSYEKKPTAQAGIIFAQCLQATGKRSEAARVLKDPVFDQAEPWIKKQKMDLFFDLGEGPAAAAIFTELSTAAPALVNNADTAQKLAKAGQVENARKIFAKIPPNEWSRTIVARARFEFELAYGSPLQAAEAYRAFQAIGWKVDPLGRERAALLLKYPLGGWNWADLGRAMALLLSLVLVALTPLLFLLPVHYWSLLRSKRNVESSWTISPWGLRTAWLVTATGLVAITISFWAFQPEALRAAMAPAGLRTKISPTGEELLTSQGFLWAILSALTLALLWRAKAWRLVNAGVWSTWKAIGIGVGLAIGLKFVLGAYLQIVPVGHEPLAEISPLTTNLMRTLLERLGPFGLIAVTGLFVPFLEEILFRGVLLGALAKHIPFWTANVIQGVGFALMHEEPGLFPFFIGFALLNGVLVKHSRGLLAPIALHVCNNVIVCVAVIIFKSRS